jgi:hypothetical protein
MNERVREECNATFNLQERKGESHNYSRKRGRGRECAYVDKRPLLQMVGHFERECRLKKSHTQNKKEIFTQDEEKHYNVSNMYMSYGEEVLG